MSNAYDFARQLSEAHADRIREQAERNRKMELQILDDIKEALRHHYKDNEISFEVTGSWREASGVRVGINVAIDGFHYSLSVVKRD